MRRMFLWVAMAAMMVVMMTAGAAPTFALPEGFLDIGAGPPPAALEGVDTAANKTNGKPGLGDIVVNKVQDKASPIIIE